jgi:hypothetical protein
VARYEGTTSGDRTNDKLFRHACRLVHGWQLSDEAAFHFLTVWNAARCRHEPWPDSELRRKVAEARTHGKYRDLVKEDRWGQGCLP